MKTAIHVCVLLVLSAVVALGRAAEDTTLDASFVEPGRMISDMPAATALSRRTRGN